MEGEQVAFLLGQSENKQNHGRSIMRRAASTNEYDLGYRSQVVPILQPESPPPPLTYILESAEDSDQTPPYCSSTTSSLQRLACSTEREVPHRTAEKIARNVGHASSTSVPDVRTIDLLTAVERFLAYGKEKRSRTVASSVDEEKPLLRIIPTISVEEDLNGSNQFSMRRPSLSSIASWTPSEMSSQSFSIDKSRFVASKIQRLVSAFTDRAKSLKDRIAQPPTPSTDSSKAGDRVAPSPPPLNLRHYYAPSYDEQTSSRKPFHIPHTFHPQSLAYILWLTVVSTAFIYNLWGVPLRIFFPYQNETNVYRWMIVDYLADVIYLWDIFVVRPRLRFIREGVWLDEVTECRKNYIQSFGFKVDIASLIPLDLLYLYLGSLATYVRFPRMIRFQPFWELFDRLDMMVSSPLIIRIGRTLFYMLFLIHLNSCAYYSFSTWVGIQSNGFVFQGEDYAYMRCFYFALKTATKIGKNPKPENNADRTFMIFNWLIGVFICAAIIGQIRDIMAASEKQETEYREQVDRTVNLMNRLNLPPKIQNRVRQWYTYSWSTQKTLDEKSSLLFLPHNMQLDLAVNVHIQTLSKVQLFQDCDPGLIRDLVLKLKPVLFLSGDLVCKKGEVGKEMYIVKSGQVQVMGGNNNDKVLVTLGEGSVFGEISLLAVGSGNRRMADVRSQGFSQLFVLSKSDLNEALEYHPEAQKILQRKAKKLVKKSSQRKLSEESQPLFSPQEKPPTPKLLKTVLQAVSPQSKAHQLLVLGSRRASSLDVSDAQEIGKNESTSGSVSSIISPETKGGANESSENKVPTPAPSEEIMLKPTSLQIGWTNRSRTSRIKAFALFSNRVVPVDDEDAE